MSQVTLVPEPGDMEIVGGTVQWASVSAGQGTLNVGDQYFLSIDGAAPNQTIGILIVPEAPTEPPPNGAWPGSFVTTDQTGSTEQFGQITAAGALAVVFGTGIGSITSQRTSAYVPKSAAATPPASPPPGLLLAVQLVQNGTLTLGLVPSGDSRLNQVIGGMNYPMADSDYMDDVPAAALAAALGGSVKQFSPNGSSYAPLANFIVLPYGSGYTFLAASLAFLVSGRGLPTASLYILMTMAINQMSAVYRAGGMGVNFPIGYVGPPIVGQSIPPGVIVGADGNIVNTLIS